MPKLSLSQLDLNNKRVLVRVDFNVPLENGVVTDDTRIRESLPTIKKIIESGGKAILMSHLGRPKGKRVAEMSLAPAAKKLSELVGKPVTMADDCIGDSVEQQVSAMKSGDILLLENLRFYNEEEKNDPEFAKKLAALGDVYVNDAFGSAHRAHASTEGVTHFIKQCAAGFLMQKELKYLGDVLANPSRPFVAVLGGSKISGKIDVIENLIGKVDAILIGGGMAYTFFKAMDKEIGKSILETDKVELAAKLLDRTKSGATILKLPPDSRVTSELKSGADVSVSPSGEIPSDKLAADIGPEAEKLYGTIIRSAKTIIWNGPMGVFEIDEFASGTFAIAQALADATKNGATTVVGGGDSAAAMSKFHMELSVSHISTGGGASLEFLEGKTLPGVAALTEV